MKSGVNFCSRFHEAALAHPEKLALKVPHAAPGAAYEKSATSSLRYGELMRAAGRQQSALSRIGLVAGSRVLIFARPGLGLYVLILALLGLGCVPVLVDSGMSRDRIFAAIRQSGARFIVGEKKLLRLWWLFPPLWRLQRYALDGASLGLRDLSKQADRGSLNFHCESLPETAHGLITFTSGSTGLPKGADRHHGSLIAQHLAIREHWPDVAADIDLPSFPVLVLHNLSCGITSVLPATNLATPGKVDAARVVAQIRQEGISRVSGSPAYMEGLVLYALEHQLTLPGVRSVVIGGSTLTRPLAQHCLRVFPQAEVLVVYGSTEAEPISEISLPELLADWDQHPGHLVGKPASMAELRIVNPAIRLSDAASVEAATLAQGGSGEILVAGPHVLQAYVDNPEATRESKIARGDGRVWHRTGDVGHFDTQGRLWLEGRLKDAVTLPDGTLYTLPLEKAVDALPGVRRSALIGAANGRLLLALVGDSLPSTEQLRPVLLRFGVSGCTLFRLTQMPVDGRHNSKIDRPALRQLLAKQTPLAEI